MLQKFGIEIRRIGNTQNLYRDVDLVLKNAGLNRGSVNQNIQASSAAHALQKMFQTGKYLCVCTIENCAKICSVCISMERIDIYRANHCIYWNEMTPEHRQILMAMILDDFRAILNP